MSTVTITAMRRASSVRADFSEDVFRAVTFAIGEFSSTDDRLDYLARVIGSRIVAAKALDTVLRYDEVTVNVGGEVWWIATKTA